MGIMRDILDAIRDVASAVNGGSTVEDVFKQRKYSSLAKRSQEGILQFPVLVSKSLDIDTLQMITKALERQYASFVQISMTMSPGLDLIKDKDAYGYIHKFHQNSDVRTDRHDFRNAMIDALESYSMYADESKEVFMLATITEGTSNRVIAANKDALHSVLEDVRTDILNNKFIPRSIYQFNNSNLSAYHNTIVTEETKNDRQRPNNNDNIDLPREILKDNDVRKANELVPTTLHVRTMLVNQEGETQGHMDFIIGVKATMHPIDSGEMVTNLLDGVRGKGKFFNAIRWTTGETTFFKDFLFNISEIKNDVSNRSAGASPWWIALKRRRSLAKVKDRLRLPKQILPNATIVVSMEEVEFIKSEYGYDLMTPGFVDKIMEKYFLLGFVIVDNSTQICHFLFDGSQNFQSVTFSGLEHENRGKNGVDFKDVMKLIQRI